MSKFNSFNEGKEKQNHSFAPAQFWVACGKCREQRSISKTVAAVGYCLANIILRLLIGKSVSYMSAEKQDMRAVTRRGTVSIFKMIYFAHERLCSSVWSNIDTRKCQYITTSVHRCSGSHIIRTFDIFAGCLVNGLTVLMLFDLFRVHCFVAHVKFERGECWEH